MSAEAKLDPRTSPIRICSVIERFNDFKSNAALKRWQITPDQTAAIQGIVLGMTEDSRNLVRSHLDFEKYEESGRSSQTWACFVFVL